MYIYISLLSLSLSLYVYIAYLFQHNVERDAPLAHKRVQRQLCEGALKGREPPHVRTEVGELISQRDREA